jgi:hypothetical protein
MRARICPSTRTSLLSLAIVAGCLACAPDKGPGSLVVEYILGNNKMCDELGVERIAVSVYQGEIDEPTAEYNEMLICDDIGEAVVSDIEPGVYSVSAIGYDANDVAIFDNQGQPATERAVEIFEAAETNYEASLSARPAQLSIGWRLGEGGFGNCSGVGIDSFEITTFEQGGGVVLLEADLDCELGGDAMGFRLVPDPLRLLNGLRFGEVGIQPLDSSGNSVGTAATFEFTPVGYGYEVNLRIECTELGCYEQP